MSPNHVAVQNRDLASALHEQGRQRVGGGGFAGAAKPREPDADALPVARRVAVGENLRHLRAREPVGKRLAGVQVFLPRLRPGYGRRFGVRRQLGHLFIPPLRRNVGELGESERLDAHFVRASLNQVLGVVGPVERLALRIRAGARVVAPDYEIVRAVVSPDDGVPHRLARAAHPHGERQQRQQNAVLVVVALGQRLVCADAGVVVDVARSGQPDDGVEQQNAVHARRRALGQFFVDAVERIARLERRHVAPPDFRQPLPRLRRREAQFAEIAPLGKLDDFQAPG